jgi:geranylgeranyl reductase
MQKFDTIIVGAGPAGLACATVLAQKGLKVLVLERNRQVGPKVCAGGIPCHALEHLHLPESLFEKSFPVQHVSTPGQQARIKSALPIITTINREKLGQHMLQKAVQAGAEVRISSLAAKIDENRLVYRSSGKSGSRTETIGYDFLVGADGSSSIVRRYLGLPVQRIGAGIQYQVPGSFAQMEWHFAPNRFHSGYAWIFPHKERASVGVYAERQDLSPRRLKEALHLWAAHRGINLRACKPEAALINFDYRGWHFGNIYLTGDAAGLASGLTGEGIVPAILSGEAAAQNILGADSDHCRLARVLKQHQRHQMMQKLLAGNKVVCQTALEVLVLGLRLKLIPLRYIEMC